MIARDSRSYPTFGLLIAEGVTDGEAKAVVLRLGRLMFVQCKRGINPVSISALFVNSLYELTDLKKAGRFSPDPSAFVSELARNHYEASVIHDYFGCERDLDERRFYVVNGLEHGVRAQA